MKNIIIMIILFQVLAIWLLAIPVTSSEVQIFVQNGPIIGEAYRVHHRSMNRFLGIPYAKPPLQALRFQRPQPLEKWTQPRPALTWPNHCVQKSNPLIAPNFVHQSFSEDCLYLNIWSPEVNANEQNRRPVLVWIHGGALLRGTSSHQLTNMETLSAMADAITVSINYRLSALGFLYSDEVEEIKGNQGFWDQIAALEWIKNNIRYFGGDPNLVTIIGESAGARSVSALILSPASRDLFHNAIMMSGASIYRTVEEPKQQLPHLMNGIRAVGCATDEDQSVSQKIIDCLQNLDASEVDRIAYNIGSHVLPVVDGELLPSHPVKMLANGDHKQNFSLLISTVEDEGSFTFYIQDQANQQYSRQNPSPLTMQEAKQFLFNQLVNMSVDYDRELISSVYLSGLNANFDSGDLFRKQTGIAYGDLILGCPTINFAKSLFKSGSVEIFQWYYTAKLGNVKELCSKWGGTCHCDDLYPLFGEAFRKQSQYHNREREISREVIEIVRSFIRTGTPGDDQPEWRGYFRANNGEEIIAPYYEISNNHKSRASFGFNLKRLECETVWKRFYQ